MEAGRPATQSRRKMQLEGPTAEGRNVLRRRSYRSGNGEAMVSAGMRSAGRRAGRPYLLGSRLGCAATLSTGGLVDVSSVRLSASGSITRSSKAVPNSGVTRKRPAPGSAMNAHELHTLPWKYLNKLGNQSYPSWGRRTSASRGDRCYACAPF